MELGQNACPGKFLGNFKTGLHAIKTWSSVQIIRNILSYYEFNCKLHERELVTEVVVEKRICDTLRVFKF